MQLSVRHGEREYPAAFNVHNIRGGKALVACGSSLERLNSIWSGKSVGNSADICPPQSQGSSLVVNLGSLR